MSRVKRLPWYERAWVPPVVVVLVFLTIVLIMGFIIDPSGKGIILPTPRSTISIRIDL